MSGYRRVARISCRAFKYYFDIGAIFKDYILKERAFGQEKERVRANLFVMQ